MWVTTSLSLSGRQNQNVGDANALWAGGVPAGFNLARSVAGTMQHEHKEQGVHEQSSWLPLVQKICIGW